MRAWKGIQICNYQSSIQQIVSKGRVKSDQILGSDLISSLLRIDYFKCMISGDPNPGYACV